MAFVKVGWNEFTRNLVGGEATALRAVTRSAAGGVVHAPALLYAGRWNDLELAVAAPLPRQVRRHRPSNPTPLEATQEIAQLDGPLTTTSLAESGYVHGLRDRLQDTISDHGSEELALQALDAIVERAGARPLTVGTWHGDWTPWNLAWEGDRLWVFDWEHFGRAPLGFDVLHYVFATEFFGRREDTGPGGSRPETRGGPQISGRGGSGIPGPVAGRSLPARALSAVVEGSPRRRRRQPAPPAGAVRDDRRCDREGPLTWPPLGSSSCPRRAAISCSSTSSAPGGRATSDCGSPSIRRDGRSLLRGEDIVWAHHPTTRNVKNLLRNLFLAWRVLRSTRPALIVSTGAGVAVPFFIVGKLLRIRTVYIEAVERIESPSLSGRLCYPLSDAFVLQWDAQRRHYPARTCRRPPLSDDRRFLFVTTGTDRMPLTRVVRWIDHWLEGRSGEVRCLIQGGLSERPANASLGALPVVRPVRFRAWERGCRGEPRRDRKHHDVSTTRADPHRGAAAQPVRGGRG